LHTGIYITFIFVDITGVSPNIGSINGGTTITIFGEHFDPNATKIEVLVGGEYIIMKLISGRYQRVELVSTKSPFKNICTPHPILYYQGGLLSADKLIRKAENTSKNFLTFFDFSIRKWKPLLDAPQLCMICLVNNQAATKLFIPSYHITSLKVNCKCSLVRRTIAVT